jgi:heme a synthase
MTVPIAAPKFQMDQRMATPRALMLWLWAVAALVFTIVVVGGITRLTESGLSITEWKPVSGVIPPLNDAQWQAEFDKYRQIPEYQLINKGMSMAEFQYIYFWEWIHRQLGRVIGLAMALPFFWYLVQRKLPQGYALRLFAITSLIGLQGAIGWWMVSSGLETRTDVSHFRLAAHLGTALVILGGLVWTILDLRRLAIDPFARPARLSIFGVGVLFVLGTQILLGAWVAGLNAGHVSNTWPLMNDRLYPDGVDWSVGAVQAISSDPFLTHFLHRWWAWVVVILAFLLARRAKAVGAKLASIMIHAIVGTQIILGIATVLSNVHISLAVLHQAVGALLVMVTVYGVHCISVVGGTPSHSHRNKQVFA